MIGFDDFASDFLIAEFPNLTNELVVENIKEALEENQWQDQIFELGCVGDSAYDTSSIPERTVEMSRCSSASAVKR